MSSSAHASEALFYARRGWSVFPLAPRSKEPMAGTRGYLDASVNEAQVRDWWTAHPDANIGIAPDGANLWILDVDPRHGGNESLDQLETEHGKLPETPLVLTGGGGRHYYLRAPERVAVPRRIGVRPGLDALGKGGYAVAPNSLHPNGRQYAWEASTPPTSTKIAEAPEWLVRVVLAVHSSPTKEGDNGKTRASKIGESIPQGERRNTLLSLAGSMRRRGAGLDELLAALNVMNEKRCKPPLDAKEVEVIANDVAGRYVPAAAPAEEPPVHLITYQWPQPPQDAAYHGLAGEIVRAIEPHTEGDPVALLVQLLLGFANLIGREPHFVADGARHGLNLFAALVGSSSKGRKGTAWKRVLRLLSRLDAAWAESCVSNGLSSGEGLIWAVRDPIDKREPIKDKSKRVTDYTTVRIDEGVEDKRLLVQEAELSSALRAMKREGNTLSAQLRAAWDGDTLRAMTKNSPATATDTHISIVGHITRDELLRDLDKTEQGNGFGNRFLWVCVRRSKTLPEGGHPWPPELDGLLRRLEQVRDFAKGVRLLDRTPEAREPWAEMYRELSEGAPGLLGAMTARAEAQVMRLACLYALFDLVPEVRLVHLQAAHALWRYCEDSARFIFGESTGDPEADRLLAELRRRGQMDATQIRDFLGHHASEERKRRLAERFIREGLARIDFVSTGGRNREVWTAVGAAKRAERDESPPGGKRTA